jgi:septum formation protein
MTQDTLYLGSQSKARQRLLEFANIKFKTLQHSSDEDVDHSQDTFEQNVLSIAKHKMQTLQLPNKDEVATDCLFALTADTLIKSTKTGEILAKPENHEHAIRMLALEREAPVEVMTGCCLEKFQYKNGGWQSTEKVHWTTGAVVEFYVDEESVDQYFSAFPDILKCSGAGMVEDHGLSYLKSIQGSYTGVIGLPLYELRQALKGFGFK